jgi:hypothetical protein
MLSNQDARDLAERYMAALNAQDTKSALELCSDDVTYSGLLVRKVTGEASGILAGKDRVGPFIEQMVREVGDASGRAFSHTRLAIGINSLVIEYTAVGLLQGFMVLILNQEGKISQIIVHQLDV